jgi:hypothetical protein
MLKHAICETETLIEQARESLTWFKNLMRRSLRSTDNFYYAN